MKTAAENRIDYNSDMGIARWWEKDGVWHIARPCPDPDPQTGLKTGGFRYTDDAYGSRAEAILAIRTNWRIVHDPEEMHQLCGFMAVLAACGPSTKQPGKFWYSVKSTPVSGRIPTQYVDSLRSAKDAVEKALLPFCEYTSTLS